MIQKKVLTYNLGLTLLNKSLEVIVPCHQPKKINDDLLTYNHNFLINKLGIIKKLFENLIQ